MKKYILIIAAVAIVINWSSITNYLNPPPDYSAGHEEKVILYATSWCGYCDKTRKLLTENNIEYHEYDIEIEPEGKEQYDRLGVKGVPVLLINGEVVGGYNPSKILKLAKES